MKRLLSVGVALLLGAWTWPAVTWGSQTINFPDGGHGIALGYGLDGGWIDGGPLTDGGIQCTDGGGLCIPCGACVGDAGIQIDVPTDGGFAYGGASSTANVQSDPFPATQLANVTCCVCTQPYVTATVTAQLLGSNDRNPTADGGQWGVYAGTDAGATASDGGCACLPVVNQGFPAILPWQSEQITSNAPTDGGWLWCAPATQ
jgi:hypothetical protein